MRKLILASVLLLASASAYAGDSSGAVLAVNEAPAASTAAQPLPPASTTETPKAQAAAPERPQASRPSRRAQARHFGGDEVKARRIAAKYGISW
jgi:hypothetical protein